MKILINSKAHAQESTENLSASLPSVDLFDPSEFRPEYKSEELFRNYSNSEHQERVEKVYYKMHQKQTVSFHQDMREKWCHFNHCEMSIMEAVKTLDNLIDESDPDIDLPNSVHAFQTAERIRSKHPDKEWFVLTGFIHDLGKVMALFGEEQWAVVGDTYPLGCRPSETIVFGSSSFHGNADEYHPIYSTQYGMYESHCGLDNLNMSWGHDEYLYQVLRHNRQCSLPIEALYVIRFHSFYPYHTSGDYEYFASDWDKKMLPWLQGFNKFDLYSKEEEIPDIEALTPFYQQLTEKYLPGVFHW
jgi:inositol oxygenase